MSGFHKLVARVAAFMHGVAGLALGAIVLFTVTDVILRLLRHPIVGTYELVGLLGALVIGLSLPQSTLQRVHVLMDFLTDRLPAGKRRVLEIFTRILGMGFFLVLGLNLWDLADDLRTAGEVSPTLQLPQYPVAYAVALAVLVQCLVLLCQALPQGRRQP